MVDCVDGFPHSTAVGNIGGFLTEPGVAPAAGEQDLTDPGIFLMGENPFGYRIIGDFGTADLVWSGTEAPPADASSYFEFDLSPMYEASYVYNSVYQYRPADGHAWITANGVAYGLLFLLKKDSGDLVFWLTKRFSEESGLDALIDGDFVDAVYLEQRIDTAVAQGRAIVVPDILSDSLWYKISVAIDRTGTTASFTLSLTEHDYTTETDLGSFGTISLTNVTDFGGFANGYLWHPRTPFINNLGQPRLLVPGGCPIADPLPVRTPKVLALAAPTACDVDMTSPDELYSGPVLDTFKVAVPIGDNADSFTMTLESVCDKPMTISGIEWSAWLFNNSRRI